MRRRGRSRSRINSWAGLLLAAATAAGAAPIAAQPQEPSLAHVRPLSPTAKELVDYALQVSDSIRRMVARLETTDVIALVQLSDDASATPEPSWLKFVGGSRSSRFVLINLPTGTLHCKNTPMLAHELAHALEIADDPGARDPQSVARLFSHIGYSLGERVFETDAAATVEACVRWEIARGNRDSRHRRKNGGVR